MNNVSSSSNVDKSFDNKTVLKNLNMELPKGRVMGLLGKNGAGKTTLIHCALGLLKPTAGEIQLMGELPWNASAATRHRIGFVAQRFDAFHWMKVSTLLEFTGSFYKNWDEQRVKRLLSDWEIGPKEKVATLSEGQKQRLSIIQALGHDPELLVLDEPVASLDPSARRQFIKQLIELNTDVDKTVLFSTHITSDLERVASDIALLKDGRIYYQGELDSLKEKIVRLRIQSQHDLPEVLPILQSLHTKVEGNIAVVTTEEFNSDQLDQLQQELNASITSEQLSLEDIFLEIHR